MGKRVGKLRSQTLIPIGTKFHRLELMSKVRLGEYGARGRRGGVGDFLCDCGKVVTMSVSKVRSGAVKSCGCLHLETVRTCRVTHGHSSGGRVSETYQSWSAALNRATCKTAKTWKDYGGRGIGMSKSWLKFENFLKDMGERPRGMTLDRIDNNRGYSKSNCRWVSHAEQNRNRRSNTVSSMEMASAIRDDKKSGMSNVAIAMKHGVTASNVSHICCYRAWDDGLPIEDRPVIKPRTKLSDDSVVAIRKDNRVHRIIALEYGVSQSTISTIKKNRTRMLNDQP